MKRAAVVLGMWCLFTAVGVAVVWAFDLSTTVAIFLGVVVGYLGVTAGLIAADEWVGYR